MERPRPPDDRHECRPSRPSRPALVGRLPSLRCS